jgi:hypothetical protein
MFNLRLFRFRSPERNRENDNRRIALILKTVRSALADAESEAKGLRARILKARQSSIFLVERIDGRQPEPTRDLELRGLELRLLTAESRLAELKDHIAALRKIEDATKLHHRPADLAAPQNERQSQQ